MACKTCNGDRFIPKESDGECIVCALHNNAFQAKVIADHLRYVICGNRDPSLKMSDKEIIQEHGGDTQNRIIASGFEDETYLYRSIDQGITVYVLIDTRRIKHSVAVEAFGWKEEEWFDSQDENLPCAGH